MQFPAGWSLRYGANLVTAELPDLTARVRYRERLQPQPAFSAVVAQTLAEDPEFRVHELGDMTRVVTAEGEYGAAIAISSRAATATSWLPDHFASRTTMSSAAQPPGV